MVNMIGIVDDPAVRLSFGLFLKGKTHGGDNISRLPADAGKQIVRLPVRLLTLDHIESDHRRARAALTV